MTRVNVGILLIVGAVVMYIYKDAIEQNPLWLVVLPTTIAGYWYATRCVYSARDGIAASLRALLIAGAVGFLAFHFAAASLATPTPEKQTGIAAVAALVAYSMVPARSRRISSSEKRKAIGLFESRTGKKYDSQVHHIDHIWPFAKGGNNTADNLRVLDKQENLRKGKRRPRVKDWL